VNIDFIYGTAWKENQTAPLVRKAISAGFRAIDTANQRRHYHEAGVGKAVGVAIDAGQLARNELFLQTKFTPASGQDQRLPYALDAPVGVQVLQSFASSLDNLGVDYVDAYLLHGPASRDALVAADWEAWKSIEQLARSGKTCAIGVSNFTLGQLVELYNGARRKPMIVQNRCFANRGWDREVRAFCRAHRIMYQGFSLLTANVAVATDLVIERPAARTGKTPAQVIFRFAKQSSIVPLTGTTSSAHMQSDLDIEDFSLTRAEMKAIDGAFG
jgi:diketogulonate reductase-like aldo/keto reductase